MESGSINVSATEVPAANLSLNSSDSSEQIDNTTSYDNGTVCGFLKTIREFVDSLEDPLADESLALTSGFINRVIAEIMPGGSALATYEHVDSRPANKRITISIKTPNANYSTETSKYCHGMILDYPSMSVLCLPSAGFDLTGKTLRPIDEYDVYVADDGTVINLYYWNFTKKWYISSARGFDMGDLKWIGDLTYKEVFASIMTCPLEEFGYNMNQNFCYTIGIRHHAWHPMLTDPQRSWFIQCVDVSALDDPEPRLAFIRRNEIADIDADILLPPPQARVDITLAEINDTNSRALDTYRASIRGGVSDLKPHHGYILRSRTGYPDVRLESDLGAYVRKIVYNYDRHAKTELNNMNRMQYVVLRAHLHIETDIVFRQLYSQYVKSLTEVEEKMRILTDLVVDAVRGGTATTMSPAVIGVTTPGMMKLAAALAPRIEIVRDPSDRSRSLVANSPHAKSYVANFLRFPRNLPLLFKAFYG